jgi:exonuclease-1
MNAIKANLCKKSKKYVIKVYKYFYRNRDVNRRRAAELLRQDKPNEARTYLQRCVDVTHTMAVQLMRECRSRNIDCITAPYEADAQLAYLNINNIAHVVITEDSDLLLFGCTRVREHLTL